MKTLVFRNQEQLKVEEVVKKFSESISTCDSFSAEESEALATAFAKDPVDKFIVFTQPTVEAAQGDILFWSKNTPYYQKNISLVTDLKKTTNLVLQEGDSLTGDHRLVLLEGSKYTLKKGTYKPSILQNKSRWNENPTWDCRTLKTDKPFLIFHREHGNLVLPAGEYMICTALDPASSSFTRMMD